MAKDLKRSIAIAGHRTSISLEPEFWAAFTTLAQVQNKSVAELVAEIDSSRVERNLSSAIRVYVLQMHLSQSA
jgi:predicted DNA-binding ribbon-helix-helix protein